MRRKSKASSATAAASTGTTPVRRTMFGLGCLCVLAFAAFTWSGAPSVGAAESFPGQGFLPDNRAWEMVSPPDKHGGNVAAVSTRTQAAADGDGVSFFSTVGFADVHGTEATIEYIAQRDGRPGTNGWGTHAITPRLSPLNFVNVFNTNFSNYRGDFSADLSHAVFFSARPLTDAPNVAEVANLYLRSDLRSPGTGTYELLSDAAAPLEMGPELEALGVPPAFVPFSLAAFMQPALAGASTDFSHVIFESRLGLTPGTSFSFEFKLYENAEGTVRLVGRVPQEPDETSCDDAGGPSVACVDAPSSQSGVFAGGVASGSGSYSARMISADGSRIFFQSPTNEGAAGNVYLRENGSRTFLLNVDEKEPLEAPAGEAQLWDASRDGSRAFFTTPESLVEEDEDGGGRDLYMYEADKPEDERLTLLSVDNQPPDDGSVNSVIGASDDGHYVYFVASGRLVAGGPTPVFRGLYLWHDGQISYIGQFAEEPILNTPRTVWTLFTQAKTSRVTPDGHHLLFMTQSDEGFKGIGGFTGYDHGSTTACDYGGLSSCREFYTYSADSGRLRCASCNPSGATATADALDDVKADPGPITTTSHQSHALSDDGRYVFFSTEERLVPEDTNGTSDAYLYDTTTEEPHLLSSGQDKSPSYFMDASADGHDAFIATAEQLSGWDTDTSYDLYDARVDGGLPEPLPPPPSCQGDACQPTSVARVRPNLATATSSGSGNQPSARNVRCAKGRHKVKARNGKSRCVKRHAAKHQRAAKHNRRAGR
jgi:hypothetical protein